MYASYSTDEGKRLRARTETMKSTNSALSELEEKIEAEEVGWNPN